MCMVALNPPAASAFASCRRPACLMMPRQQARPWHGASIEANPLVREESLLLRSMLCGGGVVQRDVRVPACGRKLLPSFAEPRRHHSGRPHSRGRSKSETGNVLCRATNPRSRQRHAAGSGVWSTRLRHHRARSRERCGCLGAAIDCSRRFRARRSAMPVVCFLTTASTNDEIQ